MIRLDSVSFNYQEREGGDYKAEQIQEDEENLLAVAGAIVVVQSGAAPIPALWHHCLVILVVLHAGGATGHNFL